MNPIKLSAVKFTNALRICGLIEDRLIAEKHSVQLLMLGTLVFVRRKGFPIEVVFPGSLEKAILDDNVGMEAFGWSVGAKKGAGRNV
jgi:hypothetical protein